MLAAWLQKPRKAIMASLQKATQAISPCIHPCTLGSPENSVRKSVLAAHRACSTAPPTARMQAHLSVAGMQIHLPEEGMHAGMLRLLQSKKRELVKGWMLTCRCGPQTGGSCR